MKKSEIAIGIRHFRLKTSLAGVLLHLLMGGNAHAQQQAELNAGYFPVELSQLQKEIEIVLRHAQGQDVSFGQLQEATAATQTQEQRWYPVLSANGSLSRSKTTYLEDAQETFSTTPGKDLQYALNLRQNIFSGGSDLKKNELARQREALASLRFVLTSRQLIRRWLRDVVTLQYRKALVGFADETVRQAIALDSLARRKEASGFLGKRDLLDSQRELLRTRQQAQVAQHRLTESIERHKRDFAIEHPENLAEVALAPIFKRSEDSLRKDANSLSESLTNRCLTMLSAQLESETAQLDLQVASSSRFGTRLDAVANAGESRQLSGTFEKTSATSLQSKAASNRSQSWSIALNAEVSINPPSTFGLVEESRARLATARLSEAKTREGLMSGTLNALLRLKQIAEQKKLAVSLVEVTQNLFDKNQRLFDAGEVTIDRLIQTQQDLDKDKQALATLANDEKLLALDLTLALTWQLPVVDITSSSAP